MVEGVRPHGLVSQFTHPRGCMWLLNGWELHHTAFRRWKKHLLRATTTPCVFLNCGILFSALPAPTTLADELSHEPISLFPCGVVPTWLGTVAENTVNRCSAPRFIFERRISFCTPFWSNQVPPLFPSPHSKKDELEFSCSIGRIFQ